jgi:hypothetical protein
VWPVVEVLTARLQDEDTIYIELLEGMSDSLYWESNSPGAVSVHDTPQCQIYSILCVILGVSLVAPSRTLK